MQERAVGGRRNAVEDHALWKQGGESPTLTSILECPTDLQDVEDTEEDHEEQREEDGDRVGHAGAHPPEPVGRKFRLTT
ncbi:hypothetical protein L798_15142 [Zootermopsis nevadensis]|uniref:Uncharacterized protein n=1 Tax=Zootermopsis nevadensis TaxID=136037 RepID=A0A067QMU6_ZOONE|nr:hypothetical protein L798_15142 [Zootermopsis nevadensis]